MKTMAEAQRMKISAIDDLPSEHPVWLALYAAPVFGALLAGGWLLSRFFTWLEAGGVGAGVLAAGNVAVAATMLFAPSLAAFSLAQLVVSRRRRRTAREQTSRS